MVMYANEDETKEKWKLPEIKNELQHIRCEKTINIIIIINSTVIIIIIISIIAMIIYAAISSE